MLLPLADKGEMEDHQLLLATTIQSWAGVEEMEVQAVGAAMAAAESTKVTIFLLWVEKPEKLVKQIGAVEVAGVLLKFLESITNNYQMVAGFGTTAVAVMVPLLLKLLKNRLSYFSDYYNRKF